MYFSPDKKKIRSKTDLIIYLHKNNLDLDPNDFDFTVRGRNNSIIKKTPTPKKKPPSALSVSKLATSASPFSNLTKALKSSSSQSNSQKSVPPLNKDNPSDGVTTTSSGPKLIVKFEFPVKRLKRSLSMKSKKKKKKTVSRQSSQSNVAGDSKLYHENHDVSQSVSEDSELLDQNENSVPLLMNYNNSMHGVDDSSMTSS